MVVVTIIALFSALVLPKMFRRADAARVTAARAQINGFLTALGAYKLDTSTLPTTEQGLRALRVAPGRTCRTGTVRICRRTCRTIHGVDPYVYKYPGEHGDEPDIVSYGADGTPGGEDVNADVLSWKNQ